MVFSRKARFTSEEKLSVGDFMQRFLEKKPGTWASTEDLYCHFIQHSRHVRITYWAFVAILKSLASKFVYVSSDKLDVVLLDHVVAPEFVDAQPLPGVQAQPVASQEDSIHSIV